MKNNTPTEFEEQMAFVRWMIAKGLKFTSIPNSTYTSSWNQKRKNKDSGLNPGIPDLIILIPNVGIAFVEMKRTKGGKVSNSQEEWIKKINEIPCAQAKVCHGANEAIAFIGQLTEYNQTSCL